MRPQRVSQSTGGPWGSGGGPNAALQLTSICHGQRALSCHRHSLLPGFSAHTIEILFILPTPDTPTHSLFFDAPLFRLQGGCPSCPTTLLAEDRHGRSGIDCRAPIPPAATQSLAGRLPIAWPASCPPRDAPRDCSDLATNSWLYVPLLHAAAGEMPPDVLQRWRADQRTAWWEDARRTLAASHPVLAWLGRACAVFGATATVTSPRPAKRPALSSSEAALSRQASTACPTPSVGHLRPPTPAAQVQACGRAADSHVLATEPVVGAQAEAACPANPPPNEHSDNRESHTHAEDSPRRLQAQTDASHHALLEATAQQARVAGAMDAVDAGADIVGLQHSVPVLWREGARA